MFAQDKLIGMLRSSQHKHCAQPGKQPGTLVTAKCSLLSDDFTMLHNGDPYLTVSVTITLTVTVSVSLNLTLT